MVARMGFDESTTSIENKVKLMQSIEDILEKAKHHPAIDTAALVKARNAVHRSLVQELMTYNTTSDRQICTTVGRRLEPFELRFKPMPLQFHVTCSPGNK
ncbi:MAG: hypothetical protein GYA24_06695 [Candidatus Lokiarchaeota archaeon]|nr:hypothetical protein [Candidatus Lokiarchaeota archaeon]